MTKKLSETSLVHPTARVENSTLGRWTEIAERSRVSESELGDYSYMMQDCAVWCATIRKFSNIAASARINATNHPTWRPTLHHFTYRASDYWDDAEHESEGAEQTMAPQPAQAFADLGPEGSSIAYYSWRSAAAADAHNQDGGGQERPGVEEERSSHGRREQEASDRRAHELL